MFSRSRRAHQQVFVRRAGQCYTLGVPTLSRAPLLRITRTLKKTTLMKNLGQMMKKAQEFQSRMGEMQEKLADLEFIGTAAGGRVEATLNGKGEARKVRIDPALIDAGEADMLEDLIVAAFNDAKGKQEQAVREKMSELTGGLPLPPGMQLPF